MFLHVFQPCLWQCSVVEEITHPVIHSSVHGKHNGENFESVFHSTCKLLSKHPILIFPILNVQIDLLLLLCRAATYLFIIY